jgi:hypothetical protein
MTDPEVKLTSNHVQRSQTSRALPGGRLTTAEAAALGLSRRQVQRLKSRLRSADPGGLVRGSTARAPVNKTPDSLGHRPLDRVATPSPPSTSPTSPTPRPRSTRSSPPTRPRAGPGPSGWPGTSR